MNCQRVYVYNETKIDQTATNKNRYRTADMHVQRSKRLISVWPMDIPKNRLDITHHAQQKLKWAVEHYTALLLELAYCSSGYSYLIRDIPRADVS